MFEYANLKPNFIIIADINDREVMLGLDHVVSIQPVDFSRDFKVTTINNDNFTISGDTYKEIKKIIFNEEE